jgi:hypothetical protein
VDRGEGSRELGEIGESARDAELLRGASAKAEEAVRAQIDEALSSLETRQIAGVREDLAIPQGSGAEELAWHDDHLTCERPGQFQVEAWAIADLRAGVSTFADVRSRFGEMNPIHPEGHETAPRALCYRFGAGSVAVFESSPLAPVEGGVTAISLLDPSYVSFVDKCVVVEDAIGAAAPRERVPGAPREAFERLAGPTYCRRDANRTDWHFLEEKGDWSTLTRLRAYFAEGKLQWWHVYRVQSK